MSYMDIDNLYKDTTIVDLFKECYATEKIHGTSAHIRFDPNNAGGQTSFFSGGVDHAKFTALFDKDKLTEIFKESEFPGVVFVYGEAYGGKCQGMGATYGPELRFIVFEVKVGEHWLSVPKAENVALRLGLEFVHYRKIPATAEAVEAECLLDSVQAVRNGRGEGRMREGVVLHPLIELRKNNGGRVIAKHKRPEFRETTKEVNIDPAKREAYASAKVVAEQWVTPMRLTHVLDKLNMKADLGNMRMIINGMFDDVKKEGVGFEWTPEIQKFIGSETAKIVKQRIAIELKEGHESTEPDSTDGLGHI